MLRYLRFAHVCWTPAGQWPPPACRAHHSSANVNVNVRTHMNSIVHDFTLSAPSAVLAKSTSSNILSSFTNHKRMLLAVCPMHSMQCADLRSTHQPLHFSLRVHACMYTEWLLKLYRPDRIVAPYQQLKMDQHALFKSGIQFL